jgi:hypothetical protein
LADPQPVAIRIVEAKLSHTVKRFVQAGDIETVLARLAVILDNVVGIEVENTFARRIRMMIDRLIDHQATFAEREHGPVPSVIRLLDPESELLIELDTGGHAPDGQHRDETIHLHLHSLIGVRACDDLSSIAGGLEYIKHQPTAKVYAKADGQQQNDRGHADHQFNGTAPELAIVFAREI